MIHRVESTKLTEEEHNRLLHVCNLDGCTPSSYIKEAILGFLKAEEDAIAGGTHDSCLVQKHVI
jgi:predicted DNA-binding protein